MLLAVSLKLVHSKPSKTLRIRLNLPFLKVTLSRFIIQYDLRNQSKHALSILSLLPTHWENKALKTGGVGVALV